MPKLVSTGSFTIVDTNDYIFQGITPPSNPIKNVTVWIDTSLSPPQQKIWNGTAWVVVNEVLLGGRNLVSNGDFERGLDKWTVNNAALVTGPTDYILSIPFNNSITDVSGINTMTGTKLPTFGTGRKGNDVAAIFNGSNSINTTNNLVIDSDKISVSLWVKLIAYSTGAVIVELGNSAPSDTNSFFDIIINFNNNFRFRPKGNQSFNAILIDTWYHFVGVADLSLDSSNEVKLYMNGSLVDSGISPNQTGNFVNNILYVGQRGGNLLGFNGSLQDLKIYNRVLTADEITDLYYE